MTYTKKVIFIDKKIERSSLIDFYVNYLEVPKENWQKVLKRQIGSKILDSMINTEQKIGQDPSKIIEEAFKNGKKVYFWSDLHFFHNNIISYSDRPFESLQFMNYKMRQNYIDIIKDDDIVIFGGDISFGNLTATEELLRDLPGRKILVLGNHDFDRKAKFIKYHVFEIITMVFSFNYKVEDKVYNVIVSHYPIDFKFLPKNTINVHGHIHQHDARKGNINISVEHTNYSPMIINEKLDEKIKEDIKYEKY